MVLTIESKAYGKYGFDMFRGNHFEHHVMKATNPYS